MLEMKRFSQLRTSLNFSKENTILRELKGEKMYTDSKTISSFFLSFFLSFFYIRSTQVSRMPPVVLDLEKPFEVRVELQRSHDDSSTTFGQG